MVIISAGTRGAGLVAQNMPSHRRLPAAAITATVVAMLGLLAVAGASAAVGELFAGSGSVLSGVVEGLAAGGLVLVAGTVACLAALRSVVRHGGGAAPGWGLGGPGPRRRLDGGQHDHRRGLSPSTRASSSPAPC